MIELDRVTKTYATKVGPKLVLNAVSAVFPPRVNVGILGRNGAGKSTLMRILGAAETPDDGVIRRRGRVSWPMGIAPGLVGSLTAEENCHFVARIHGADPDTVAGFVRGFADVGDYFTMPVKTYSSGMRQRINFSLSMALDFDYYLVDEGLGAGDSAFGRRARQAIKARADHAAIIMVSHSHAQIQQWCELFAVLRDGRLEFFEHFGDARRIYEESSV